jgi:hypothetical protein
MRRLQSEFADISAQPRMEVSTMAPDHRTEEDVVKRLETWGIDDADSEELYSLLADASREIKRLREFELMYKELAK